MKHTTAPWHAHTIDTINDAPALWEIRDRYNGTIATIESVTAADAALIAAAPDLLESVKELLCCIQPDRDWHEAKRARAAIAKATQSLEQVSE